MSDPTEQLIDGAGMMLAACKEIGAGMIRIALSDKSGAPVAIAVAVTEPGRAGELAALCDRWDKEDEE